jgi:hypothetical protein
MGYGTVGESVLTDKIVTGGTQKELHFLYKREYTLGMKNYFEQ